MDKDLGKKQRSEMQNLSTRQYLDQTVATILLQGLNTLAKERPPDPIQYLATYLLQNKTKEDGGENSTTNGATN